ncbi:MAG: DUF2961 domain-containing protein [Nitrospirae bacterium]|nr:DUF2961 domain-containing protein [Nitrospirota bacterium]
MPTKLLLRMFCALTVAAGSCGDPTSSKGPGWDALERWDALPVLGNGAYRQFSSYDRLKRTDYPVADPGNKDANNFLAVCARQETPPLTEQDDPGLCDAGLEGFLIARVSGQSGFVSRLWLTAAPFYSNETIRIYADDLTRPAYEGRPADWANRTDPIFTEPLAGPRSGAVVSYRPIPFKHDLRVYLDKLLPVGLYFYQVDTQLDLPVEDTFAAVPLAPANLARYDVLLNSPGSGTESRRAGETNSRSASLEPSEGTTVFDLKGPGTIRKLSFSLDATTLSQLRSLTLGIRWDEETEYSVQLPLSAFFGNHLSIQPYSTLPMEIQRQSNTLTLSTYFPMPFQKAAEIRLMNASGSPVSFAALARVEPRTPTAEWGYFGTEFNETVGPFQPNLKHPIVSLDGRGKYVGTFMFMEGHKDVQTVIADAFNFLEGDEFGTIDGELRIPGTGTEDYFNAGFYYLKGLFDSPFAGLNHKQTTEDGRSGAISTYRWHVLSDEINFSRSFDLNIEYGANRPDLADRYASVAYYYLSRP